ncbi:MAG: hypothetical protein BAJALOKI2v1_700017 [Promethearchaeota archaeon]|nr:MAG: hypothetical protein BAJALOKI2v1_700017 [Candidatus Lokiarchaeota archaeon]
MSKLKVEKVIIFKHGVSYFLRSGTLEDSGKFELEFDFDEMNDVLKSLFVLDTSEQGFISSISYETSLDSDQLLKSIMLDIPSENSFSSLIKQIKGAEVSLTIGDDIKMIDGTIMGIEYIEKTIKEHKITEKIIPILKADGKIVKIPFSEISSFEIKNEDLRKDLSFFLNTSISSKKKESKKITINCESGGEKSERTILVNYIHASPVWKTSYRLIMSEEQAKNQKCLLSGWAMVENTTNEDWEDIELSLVAGMPVSFIYDFYKPIFIERPVIEPPKTASARPAEIEEKVRADQYKSYVEEAEMEMAGAPAPSRARKMKEAPAPTMGFGGGLSDDRLMEKLETSTKTTSKDLGELFEYNISNPVSIKRKQSALVPILTEQIKAKRVLLYDKTKHQKNPHACLEITNDTSLTLESGPSTIIYKDNLAGEAVIPFLNKGDTRLLNYAVELAVLITHEQNTENKRVHKVSFGGGYSYEYFYTLQYNTYKIKNKTDEQKELYLDHPKNSGFKILESPVDPEETTNYWRFKLKIEPKGAIEFKIKERKENYRTHYISSWTQEQLLDRISLYVNKKFIDTQLESKLKEIADDIGQLNKFKLKKSELEREIQHLNNEQERLRENISVLGDSTQEATLREKYVKKLTDQENRFEEIKSEAKQLQAKLDSLNQTIQEKINDLS